MIASLPIAVIMFLISPCVAMIFTKRWRSWVFRLGSLVGGALGLVAAGRVLDLRETYVWSFAAGEPWGTITFSIDPLSAFFIALVALIGTAVCFYFETYQHDSDEVGMSTAGQRLWLGVLVASMLAIPTVSHALVFLVVWELMSLSSGFLVLAEHRREEVRFAALNYLVSMHVGVFCLVVAFSILMNLSGSEIFSDFIPFIRSGWQMPVVVVLFLLGFGMKAGLFPMHTWIPKAYAASPSPVSALMSAVVTKMGIYGFLRVLLWLGEPPAWLGVVLLTLGLISAFIGVVQALFQQDIKRIIAYSSVENIGLIVVGMGIGTIGLSLHADLLFVLGFGAALFHLLNHALFKAVTFMGAGVVIRLTGFRSIERLGGLVAAMPVVAGLSLIGAVGVAGLPPFGVFSSKFCLLFGVLSGIGHQPGMWPVGLVLVLTLLALVSALTLVAFARFFGIAFLGNSREVEVFPGQTIGRGLWIPMAVLASLGVLMGIAPKLGLQLVWRAMSVFSGVASGFPVDAVNSAVSDVGIASTIFVLLFLAVLGFRHSLLKGRVVRRFKTWDCGYQAGTPRMQYSGFSFVEPMASLFGPFVSRELAGRKIVGLFPERADFRARFTDMLEGKLLSPLLRTLRRGFGLMSWIQSGHMQRYLVYGLVFLTGAILWTLGGL